MTEQEILDIFSQTGALLQGHFELRSKLHSDRYFQCANVLRYPRIAARLPAVPGRVEETVAAAAVATRAVRADASLAGRRDAAGRVCRDPA